MQGRTMQGRAMQGRAMQGRATQGRAMRRKVMGLAAALLGLAGACGGEGESEDEPDVAVTFESLPQLEREHFAAWKAQPLKACSWQQAFPALAERAGAVPSGAGPSPRVDLPAILAANAGSPLLESASGELVLLGDPPLDATFATDEHRSSRSVSGRTETLHISADLMQGTCILTLDGAELYRAELPAQVPVVLSFDAAALAGAGADLSPLVDAPDGHPIARTDGALLLRHALTALVPTPRAHAVLAARLRSSPQATPAAVAALFPLAAPRLPGVARLIATSGGSGPAPSEVTPFAATGVTGAAGASLLGPRAQLQPLYIGGAGGATSVELLYAGLPEASLALRVALASEAGGRDVRATAITAAPTVPFDDAAMVACFAQRQVAHHFDLAQPRSPAFAEQYLGCQALAADGFTALAMSAAARDAVADQAMSGGGSGYRGWDDAMIQVAQRMNERGLELSLLEGRGAPGAAAAVVASWRILRQGIASADAAPAAVAALERSALETAFRWHFAALAPTSPFVLEVSAAIGNAGQRFSASVQRMLADLARSVAPAGSGAAAVRCGQALVGDRRAAAARAVEATALVVYAGRFIESFSADFLQRCPSPASLAALESSAAEVALFVAADARRDGGNSPTFPLAAASLVEHALEQRWSLETFAALPDLLGFAVLSKYQGCSSYASQAQRAGCIDPAFELLGTGGLLAPAVTARHAELARALTARWPTLDGPAFFTARFDLQDAFFRGLWLGCSDLGFSHSRAALLQLLTALVAAPTFDARLELEQQLRELTDASTCS